MRHLCLLVCCLAACGDDSVRHTPDAAPHDGPIADMAPDGPPLPVTITATIGGAPQAGVQVYFLNADSSVVLSTTTDANGTASAVMAAGGSVTALDPFAQPLPPQTAIAGGDHSLYTFMGVKPGDNLVLADTVERPSIVVTVNAPVDTAAGVVTYDVQTPCGSNTLTDPGSGANPTGQIGLSMDCGTTTDFLLVTRDANNGVIDYAYVPNQAISDGATIDLTAATYAAGSTRTYSYTNIPATFGAPSFTDSIVTSQGTMLSLFNYAPSDGSATPVATVGIGTHLVQTDIFGASLGRHELVDWGPYTDTYTADITARVLPDLQGFPQLDPTTHEITLDEAAGGATPDLMMVPIYTYRQSDNTDWYWQIAAPHATTLTMPTLPTDLYDFTIMPSDSFDTSGLLIAKVPGGYDTVRAHVFANDPVQGLTVSASGSAAIEQVFGKLARKGRPGVR